MATITLKGREIPLLYTTYEMKIAQEEIGPLSEMQYKLFGRNKDDDKDTSLYAGPEHIGAVSKLIRILGNAGLEEAGEDPNLTDKWIMRALKPVDLADAINRCSEAMNEGMSSEIPPKKQEGPVDVTLEEITKKKEKAG